MGACDEMWPFIPRSLATMRSFHCDKDASHRCRLIGYGLGGPVKEIFQMGPNLAEMEAGTYQALEDAL